MNGIRLAAFALAALGFLQLDLSDALAQGPPPGVGRSRQRGQEQPATDEDSRGRSNNSRSSRSRRSSRSSRSSRSNAIKTNPLFQFLDTNGDGELSLEEIDAASRMLYSLDENEDDTITADEVEDMATTGGGAANDEEDDDDRSARSSRSSRGSERASRGTKTAPKRTRNGGNQKTPEGAFADLDKNDDGFLSRTELPAPLRTVFSRMDANRDDEIGKGEWIDFFTK